MVITISNLASSGSISYTSSVSGSLILDVWRTLLRAVLQLLSAGDSAAVLF